jgi:hypothetical protein
MKEQIAKISILTTLDRISQGIYENILKLDIGQKVQLKVTEINTKINNDS